MRPIEIGLVDTTGTVPIETMAAAVAAFNVQITQHLPRFWPTVPAAVVRLITDPKSLPHGCWPIRLVKELKMHEGGFHYVDHNQPAAKVVVTPGSNDWTIDASHELLEMLVDPGGNRLQMGKAIGLNGTTIIDAEGDCEFLLEVCDPCEAKEHAYKIGGIAVSDFITPDFYSDTPVPGERYSFSGSLNAPRQIARGGYITWVRARDAEIEQMLWLDTDENPRTRTVGKATDSSVREFVDRQTRHHVHEARQRSETHQNKGGKRMRFQIHTGKKTQRTRYEKAHTVTYHQDGEIEREVWEHGSEHPKIVHEKVKAGVPVHRPAGTEHTVRNKGGSLLTGDKDMLEG